MRKARKGITAVLLCTLITGVLLISPGCQKAEKSTETGTFAQGSVSKSTEKAGDEETAKAGTGNENSESENKNYKEENVIYDVAVESGEDAPAISRLTFTYNGETLTYPFTLRDVESLGVSFQDSLKEITVSKGGGQGNIDGRAGTNQGKIAFAVDNLSGEEVNVMDCVVTYISTTNTLVAVNSVQPGVTTYEEVLELFGRDKEERKNTLENENIRNEDKVNLDIQLNYSAKVKEPGAMTEYIKLIIMMNSEGHEILDSVYSVTYSR